MNAREVISQFIKLRERKAALKAEYEEKASKIQEHMDKIETALLKTFAAQGVDSLKTDAGTAFQSTRTSASVSDKELFLEFVRIKEEWALLDIRASKSAVEQFVASNQELPPGVNWRSERVVTIRRAA
jgi:hypothetical protein